MFGVCDFNLKSIYIEVVPWLGYFCLNIIELMSKNNCTEVMLWVDDFKVNDVEKKSLHMLATLVLNSLITLSCLSESETSNFLLHQLMPYSS